MLFPPEVSNGRHFRKVVVFMEGIRIVDKVKKVSFNAVSHHHRVTLHLMIPFFWDVMLHHWVIGS
jgi:hypothetical protein